MLCLQAMYLGPDNHEGALQARWRHVCNQCTHWSLYCRYIYIGQCAIYAWCSLLSQKGEYPNFHAQDCETLPLFRHHSSGTVRVYPNLIIGTITSIPQREILYICRLSSKKQTNTNNSMQRRSAALALSYISVPHEHWRRPNISGL